MLNASFCLAGADLEGDGVVLLLDDERLCLVRSVSQGGD